MPKNTPKIPKEMQDLAHIVGLFMQYWGFKKVHGEIWVHLFLTKKPLTSASLVKRIGVSKTFVSFAIKDLLDYKVIEIVDQPDKRKVLLTANPNVEQVIINVLKSREKELIENAIKAEKAFSHLSKDTKISLDIDDDRLESLQIMTQMAQLALQHIIKNNLDLSDCTTEK